MTTRAMLFIDGTWLGVVANRLAEQYGVMGRTGGPLDFGKLPRVLSAGIEQQMTPGAALDVVRTHWFGSIASNYDLADHDVVQKRAEFYDALRRQHRYEVTRFETDYRGGRVRRAERPADVRDPHEKAVDVGLATALLEMAALNAYDIAIVIAGDRDFVPALQAVRRLGKRVALVSARGSCPREFSDVNDVARVRDFDLLLLDALWPDIVSPLARAQVVASALSSEAADADPQGATEAESDEVVAPAREYRASRYEGVVARQTADGRVYVRGDDGGWYFFRRVDLREPDVMDGIRIHASRVTFAVDKVPEGTRAGRAVDVAVVSGGEASAPSVPAHARHDTVLWDLDPFAAPVRLNLS